MNGNFEIEESAYPIGYLRIGDGYKVCDMRNLKPLHSEPIEVERCASIAKNLNRAIRSGEISNNPDDIEALVASIRSFGLVPVQEA